MTYDPKPDAREFVEALRPLAQPAVEILDRAEDVVGAYDQPARHRRCGNPGCIECARADDRLDNPCGCGECSQCAKQQLKRRRKP